MVILRKCEEYDFNKIKEIVREAFIKFNVIDKITTETNVFIKLNCVGPFNEEMGITTHPLFLKAVLQIVKEKTNKILVGDNPAVKEIIYTMEKCGLYKVIKEENVEVFNPKIFTHITNHNPKLYSHFEVSKQMIDADVLINLPKLKTHSLAYMTAAQKNFFGLIYGLNKSSWHTKASNPLEFGEAINDLYGALLENFKTKTILHICDGIIGLEGEGPSTGGRPKKANCVLSSLDAISLDRVALEVAHLDYSRLFINQIGAKRNYGEADLSKIEIYGNTLEDFKDVQFLAPRDSLSIFGLRFLRIKLVRNILLEHPFIEKSKCIRCGECTRICPAKAMTIKAKEFPKLESTICIRCWCCAEVCPQNAIFKTNRPLIGRIFLKGDK